MDGTQLSHVCDRLAAKLDDGELSQFQLINMATVLTLTLRPLQQGYGGRNITDTRRIALDDLKSSLHWLRDYVEEAPVTELRTHVAEALDAAARILGRDSLLSGPRDRHQSSQGHTYG